MKQNQVHPVASSSYSMYLKAGVVFAATTVGYFLAKTTGILPNWLSDSDSEQDQSLAPIIPAGNILEPLDVLGSQLSFTSRHLLTAMVTGDVQINSYTNFDQSLAVIRTLPSGGFVSVWQSYGQDGSGWGIFLQIFDDLGIKVGSERQVNLIAASSQQYPDVAVSPTGILGVTYLNTISKIAYIQRLNASGIPFSVEQSVPVYYYGICPPVNCPSLFVNIEPDNQNFTVMLGWQIPSLTPTQEYISMGYYNVTTASFYQPGQLTLPPNPDSQSMRYPRSRQLPGHIGFILLWNNDYWCHQSLWGVCLDSNGAQLASSFLIHTDMATYGSCPTNYILDSHFSADASLTGNIMVVWSANVHNSSSGFDIYAINYSIQCNPLTSVFIVNNYTAGDQLAPEVVALLNGNFFITWTDNSTRSGYGSEIYAVEITPSGTVVVPEFQVNNDFPGNQYASSAILLPNNNTVVAWTSDDNSDSSGAGVFFRILTPGEVTPVLKHNQLSLSQGDQVIFNSNLLSAHDSNVGHSDSALQFIFSSIQHARIELITAPGIAITTALQQQIINGQVIIIHDDSVFLPGYSVSVTDFISSSIPQAVNVTFNLKPVWVANQLIINQGETVVVSTVMLRVTDNQPDVQLAFGVSPVQHGHFESITAPGIVIAAFNQQQVDNSQIIFVSDTSNSAPSYNLTVSDGLVILPPAPATIHFNEKPILVNNQWGFFQGEVTVITPSMISVTDYVQPSDVLSINMMVNNVQHGYFAVVSNPQVAIIQFLQQQVIVGQIQFVTDGGKIAPSFSIGLSNSLRTIPSVPAVVQFNQKPLLLNNQWFINQDQQLMVTMAMLNVTDDGPIGALTYTIFNITASYFEWTLNQGTPIYQFTQQQIIDGEIFWIDNGGAVKPSFHFSLSDGHFDLPIVSASITFHARPTLTLSPIKVNQGQSALLTAQALSVDDDFYPPAQVIFTLSNLQYVQVNSTTFTQQALLNGQVLIFPDGSLNAPIMDVAVRDGYFTLPSMPLGVQFNQQPRITRNQFSIEQGIDSSISISELNAADDNPPDQLTFTVSNLNHITFENLVFPGAAITQFTFAQVQNGNIELISDDSVQRPGGSISISDGVLSTVPVPLNINFNQRPVLIENQLVITQGTRVNITSAQLNVQDDNLPSQLTYTIVDNTACQFELITSPGLAINLFTQAQLLSQQLCVVHNSSPQSPGYFVSVSDGVLSTPLSPAAVSFHYRPIITLNQFTILEGEQKPITTGMLQLADLGSSPDQLQITFSSALRIQFFLTNNNQILLTQCTFQNIIDGSISLKHDNSELAPSWLITVGNPYITLLPVIADVDFLNVNQAPVITGATDPLLYNQPGAGLVIDPALSVTDVDSSALCSAMVVITDNRNIAEDILGANDGEGIVSRYDASSAILSLSGMVSPAAYQDIMRTVYYKNVAQVPNLYPRTITMTVFDCSLNSQGYVREVDIAKEQQAVCYLKGIVALNSIRNNNACNLVNVIVYFLLLAGGAGIPVIIGKIYEYQRDKQWKEHPGLDVHNQLRRELRLELPPPHAAEIYIDFVCRLLGHVLLLSESVSAEGKAECRKAVMAEIEKSDLQARDHYAKQLASAFQKVIRFPTRPRCDDSQEESISGVRLEMPVFRYARILPSYLLDQIFCCGRYKLTSYDFSLVVVEAAFEKIVKTISDAQNENQRPEDISVDDLELQEVKTGARFPQSLFNEKNSVERSDSEVSSLQLRSQRV